jgi:endo-1,4-beta-xylanase
MEMHVDLNPPRPSDIAANMARLERRGLKVAITDMDVPLPVAPGSTPTRAEQAAQATIYHDTLATCLAHSNCRTFVTWGFTDKYSWIPSFFPGYGWALPFTNQYARKPAYIGLSVALQRH